MREYRCAETSLYLTETDSPKTDRICRQIYHGKDTYWIISISLDVFLLIPREMKPKLSSDTIQRSVGWLYFITTICSLLHNLRDSNNKSMNKSDFKANGDKNHPNHQFEEC